MGWVVSRGRGSFGGAWLPHLGKAVDCSVGAGEGYGVGGWGSGIGTRWLVPLWWRLLAESMGGAGMPRLCASTHPKAGIDASLARAGAPSVLPVGCVDEFTGGGEFAVPAGRASDGYMGGKMTGGVTRDRTSVQRVGGNSLLLEIVAGSQKALPVGDAFGG